MQTGNAYSSKNLILASGKEARSQSLKKLLLCVINEAKKYNGPDVFYKPGVQVIDYLNHKKEIIYRDLDDYCSFAYHNRYHTEHVFDLAMKIMDPLINEGKFSQSDRFVIGNSCLHHDIRRKLSGIIQTKDRNISNEEEATIKQIEDDFYSIRPNYILATATCNLATTFGQGHPNDETAREYIIENDLETIVTFSDISGFTHKKGSEHAANAFFNDSINILKEMPASKAMEWFPDFNSWINHPNMGAAGFVTNVIEKRLSMMKERGLLKGSLLKKIEDDLDVVNLHIAMYQQVYDQNKRTSGGLQPPEKTCLHEYELIFQEVMKVKEKEKS